MVHCTSNILLQSADVGYLKVRYGSVHRGIVMSSAQPEAVFLGTDKNGMKIICFIYVGMYDQMLASCYICSL